MTVHVAHPRVSSHRRAGPLLAVLAAPVLMMTGCHVSIGTGPAPRAEHGRSAIPKSDVEQLTAQQIRDKVGDAPFVITCPADLPARVGATEECVLNRDGKRFRLTVEISEVTAAGKVHWDYELGGEITGA